MTATTSIQKVAHNGVFLGKQFSGYGHYIVEVLIVGEEITYNNDLTQTTKDIIETITHTTTRVDWIDDLSSDDWDEVTYAKRYLIDSALESNNIDKADDFTYVY